MDKVYLGDSVYVEHDGSGLTMTTENGLGPSNTIYLEPEVYRALVKYVDALVDAVKAKAAARAARAARR